MGWKPGPAVFPAETCTQLIYAGLKSGFGNVSDKPSQQPRTRRLHNKEAFRDGKGMVYCGKDAYCYLGEYMAGLNSRHLFDHAVSGQVTDAWNVYAAKNPDDHKILKPYMDALFSDVALIKREILNPYSSRPTLVNIAVRMAGLSPSDEGVVVGGEKDLSVGVVLALGHKKRYTPHKITLTHPDERALNDIVNTVRGFENKSAIQAELSTIPFDQALEDRGDATTIFNAAAVIVCLPMEENVINRNLVDAWSLRSGGHPAKLIHLKGNPLECGKTTGAWEALAGADGFISYPDIVAKHKERITITEGVVEKAKEATKHLSKLRAKGDRAVTIPFMVDSGEMILDYTLARRPNGAANRQEIGVLSAVPGK